MSQAKMALTDEQKKTLLIFCGYSDEDVAHMKPISWRYQQGYHALKYRMDVLSDPEINLTLEYLSTLVRLYKDLVRDDDGNIITNKTSWTPQIEEVRMRITKFYQWRHRLCGFLGIPLGIDLIPVIADV